jgi:hypothetical protein
MKSETQQPGGSMNPAQIDPTAPVDAASTAVDDANAATDDRSFEVYELTDSD